MGERANERIVWFNGEFIPESQALVPYRDRSFLFGDGAFDLTRTFGHRIFRLDEHLERLYRSLRALRLDPTMPVERMAGITREVLERNLHLLDARDDYWVGQRITRGVLKVEGDNWPHYGPTVIVECLPMPLAERAPLFRDGIQVVTPSVRRAPPEALTPRAKSHNYLNLVMGDLEVRAQNPDAWAILLDMNGNLCEGLGSNIFLVRDGELLTPRENFVLPGISRLTAIELAQKLGIPFREADLDLYDAYNAEEAFITSTSLCICPVASINGVALAAGAYGPVTRRLIDAYTEMVDCDFVQQYLDRLG
ncbi:MAG TPA: aminotransferase class IV [Thermohalobaculum sp.]|nr:aminotransferase class IV [Thermohalobaculum sp.]